MNYENEESDELHILAELLLSLKIEFRCHQMA